MEEKIENIKKLAKRLYLDRSIRLKEEGLNLYSVSGRDGDLREETRHSLEKAIQISVERGIIEMSDAIDISVILLTEKQ